MSRDEPPYRPPGRTGWFWIATCCLPPLLLLIGLALLTSSTGSAIGRTPAVTTPAAPVQSSVTGPIPPAATGSAAATTTSTVTTTATPVGAGEWYGGAVAFVTTPFIQVVIAFVLAVWIAFGIHRARLRRLIRLPGPIEVMPINNSSGKEVQVERLNADLRRCLADVRLYAPSSVPGNGESTDFLDLVSAREPQGFIGQVVGLFRATFPRSAYRIQVTLLAGDHGSLGVSAQLHVLPRHVPAPRVIWGQNWTPLIEQAARAAAQEILPWTRRAHDPQWAGWIRRQMPDDLLNSYLRGKEMVRERRYDEALYQFNRALEMDPGNLHTRLDVAYIFEKLGLRLDALAMYSQIERIATDRRRQLRATTSSVARAWNWTLRRDFEVRAVKSAQNIANYRLLIGLCWGEELARAWAAPEGRALTKESAERRDHRADLAAAMANVATLCRTQLNERCAGLSERVVRCLRLLGDRPWTAIEDRTAEDVARAPAIDNDVRVLAQLIASAWARYERERRSLVRHGWLHYWKWHGQRHVDSLGHRSWKVVERWAEYRRAATLELDEARAWSSAKTEDNAKLSDGSAFGGKLRKLAKRSARDWLDNYNLACAWATPLKFSPRIDPAGATAAADPRSDCAKNAIDSLIRAVTTMPADLAYRHRSWILLEDPDLDELRRFDDGERFRTFQRTYMPTNRTVPTPPVTAGELERLLQAKALVQRCSRAFARAWNQRLVMPPPDSGQLLRMWRSELQCWRALHDICSDPGYWRTHADMTVQMQSWSLAFRGELFNWPNPQFRAESVLAWEQLLTVEAPDAVPDTLGHATHERIRTLRATFERLRAIVREHGATGDQVDRRLAGLLASGSSVSQAQWIEICRGSMQTWRAVGAALVRNTDKSSRQADLVRVADKMVATAAALEPAETSGRPPHG